MVDSMSLLVHGKSALTGSSMMTRVLIYVGIALHFITFQNAFAGGTRFSVKLTDGSKVIGEMSLETLPLESTVLGKMSIPIKRIRSLKFKDDHQSATVLLENGDKIEGAVGVEDFKLAAMFGEAVLPKPVVVELQFLGAIANLAEGLVVHFPLDDNDASAVRERGPSNLRATVDGARPSEGGYQFDGRSASIGIPLDKCFAFGVNDPFTLAAWAKMTAPNGNFQAIVVAAVANEGYEWEWGIYVDQKFRFMSGWEKNAVIQSKTELDADRWYHVAVAYSKGDWFLYVNGVPEAKVNAPRKFETRGGLAIGRKGDSTPPDFFKGSIRDVRIYNRALSADEIQQLFKNTAQ